MACMYLFIWDVVMRASQRLLGGANFNSVPVNNTLYTKF